MEVAVFAAGALFVLLGAIGVVSLPNTVHAALSLVLTLFGVAVLFVAQDAQFLAVVQIIVYAGAIVVLFLFVIMLLGVDKVEEFSTDRLVAQRYVGLLFGLVLGAGLLFVALKGDITGAPASGAAVDASTQDVNQIAKLLFTEHLFAFEITSVLLLIGVVAAVLLSRRRGEDALLDTAEPVTTLGRDADTEHLEEVAS